MLYIGTAFPLISEVKRQQEWKKCLVQWPLQLVSCHSLYRDRTSVTIQDVYCFKTVYHHEYSICQTNCSCFSESWTPQGFFELFSITSSEKVLVIALIISFDPGNFSFKGGRT